MPDHAGFAAAVTVREHVLRIALQSGYANGSPGSKKFVEDLSDAAVGMEPDLFLGQPDVDCEGATNLLVATLPMWGPLTVTVDQVAHDVEIIGEMELTLTPDFRRGPIGTPAESTLQLDPIVTVITARRWTAVVTSPATPAAIAALVVGDEFRSRFEQKFRQGVLTARVSLPSIDASFLGPLARKANEVFARVRNGVLLLGLTYVDDDHSLIGDANALQDFARSNDVAGVVNADAVDILLDELHTRLVEGVEDAGASLDDFSVVPRNGYFEVSGAASNSSGTVHFTFRVVPSMFHTRPGTVFHYLPKARWVKSRTWAALGFGIEGVDTDVDRAWWVILFGEVILGILTAGLATLYVEDMVSAAAANFSGRLEAAKPGAPAARVRRTIAPPGGISVRIGLDQFEVTADGTYVGISVRATPSPAVLLGPVTVPSTYDGDVLRYLLRLPSGASDADPALRIRWILEDRTNDVVLRDEDGPAAGRLHFEFSPVSFPATDYGVIARLYRQLGVNVTELGTESVNVHMRGSLPPGAYVRWRWQGKNPQVTVDEATDTWTYRGEVRVNRWSEWHRTDAPCRAVNAFGRYRYDEETADRLPFSLRLLENHRKGLCPYCFYGGPAGSNPSL